MARHVGKNGVFKADTEGGTVAAVGEIRNFSLDTAAEEIDSSTIGTDWAQSELGLKSWSGQCECLYDPADTKQEVLVEGADVDLELYPIGETSGYQYFSGTARVTGVTHNGIERSGMVTKTITFTGNGALTRATVAS